MIITRFTSGTLLCSLLLAGHCTAKEEPMRSYDKRDRKTPPPTSSSTPGLTRPPVNLDQLEAFYEEHVFEQKTTCHTYSMSQYSDNYVTSHIDGNWAQWGHHALQWKGYRHNAVTGGSGSYNPWNANTFNPPYNGGAYPQFVSCPDKDELNTIESAASNTYFDGGNSVDPVGQWMCLTETDAHVGAVTAAMGMHYWTTPTYLDAHGCEYELYWFCMIAAVIEKVTLCASGSDAPHVACGWDTYDWATNVGTISTCAASLVLDTVDFSYFGDLLVGGGQQFFFPHFSVTGADWPNYYGNWDTTLPTDLVMDPPETTTKKNLEALKKMAAATAADLKVLVYDEDHKGETVKAVSASEIKTKKKEAAETKPGH